MHRLKELLVISILTFGISHGYCSENRVVPRLQNEKIVIDGKLDDWPDRIKPILLEDDRFLEIVVETAYRDNLKDLSAKVLTAYDNENFYLGVIVNDNVHINNETGHYIWKGDCLQVAFDTMKNAKTGESYGSDDHDLAFARLFGGINRVHRYTGEKGEKGGPIMFKSSRNEKSGTTVYEVKIPWSNLAPFSPDNAHFGFSMVIFDNDGLVMDKYLQLTPGVTGKKHPHEFDNLMLEGKNASFFKAPQSVYLLNRTKALTFDLKLASQVKQGTLSVSVEREKGEKIFFENYSLPLDSGATSIPFSIATSKLESNQDKKIVLSSLVNGKLLAEKKISIEFPNDLNTKVAATRRLIERLSNLEKELSDKNISAPAITARLNLLEDFLKYIDTELNRRYALKLEKGKYIPGQALSDIERKFMYERVDANLTYLLSTGNKAIETASEILKGKLPPFTVPVIDSASLVIKDGAIYSENKPVLFIGGCTGYGRFLNITADEKFKNQTFDRIKTDRKYGFNLIDYGRCKPQTAHDYAQVAQQNNMAASVYASAKLFIPVPACEIDAKLTLAKKQIKQYALAYKDSPNVIAVKIAGEIAQCFKPCHCPKCQESFQKFLEKKYQTIKKLNSATKSAYTTFSELAIPKIPSDQKNVLLEDYSDYCQEITTDYYVKIKNIVQEIADKKIPIISFFQLWRSFIWSGATESTIPLDFEGLIDKVFTRMIGCDGSILSNGGNDYAYGWNSIQQILCYDYFRSLWPERPVCDGEFHFIRDNDSSHYSYDYIYSIIWQSVMSGVRAIQLWQWSRGDFAHVSSRNICTRAETLDAASQAALDIRRLAEPIHAFSKASSPIALFWTRPSIYNYQFTRQLRNAYEGAFFLGSPVEFVTDRKIKKLEGKRLLVMSSESRVDRNAMRQIMDWIDKGNILFVAGRISLNSKQYIGDKIIIGNKFKEEGIIRQGKGEIHVINANLKSRDYFNRLGTFLDKIEDGNSVKILDSKNKRPWGVETRQVKMANGQGTLLFLLNLNKKMIKLSLKAPHPIKKISNLINNDSLKETISLPPECPILLEVEY